MRTACPTVRLPRQPWRGLGLRLDNSTIRKDPYVHWVSFTAWVREVVMAEGGSAPVSVVLKRMAEDVAEARRGPALPWPPYPSDLSGRPVPLQEVLLEAITDEAGGFAFYAVP